MTLMLDCASEYELFHRVVIGEMKCAGTSDPNCSDEHFIKFKLLEYIGIGLEDQNDDSSQKWHEQSQNQRQTKDWICCYHLYTQQNYSKDRYKWMPFTWLKYALAPILSSLFIIFSPFTCLAEISYSTILYLNESMLYTSIYPNATICTLHLPSHPIKSDLIRRSRWKSLGLQMKFYAYNRDTHR